MRQDRLTLWKIQVVILLAAVFCAVIRAAGLITGVALIFLLIPLWSVAIWLLLTERQSTILRDAAASVLGFLVLAWIAAWLAQYAFGLPLPAVLNRLRPAMLQYVLMGMGGGYWIATKIKGKWLDPEKPEADSLTGNPPHGDTPAPPPRSPS
jgi:hypothetical protein